MQEVTEITTGLKALAKELNVPILALSQLSRQVESRDDKRPQLSDLRESGSIEQDADVVHVRVPRGILPAATRSRGRAPKSTSSGRPRWTLVHGKAEVIIGKQRHGPTGTVQLQFEAHVTRFGDLRRGPTQLPERLGRADRPDDLFCAARTRTIDSHG